MYVYVLIVVVVVVCVNGMIHEGVKLQDQLEMVAETTRSWKCSVRAAHADGTCNAFQVGVLWVSALEYAIGFAKARDSVTIEAS